MLYLFNPLPESGLAKMISNLEHSLREHPRPVFVVYHNPLLESVLTRNGDFQEDRQARRNIPFFPKQIGLI